MWTQVVGKVRLGLAAPLNHWWHVPLYVNARGLTTSPIPYQRRQFQVDFDFVDHRLVVTDTGGTLFTMPLQPRSVARFYREFMAGLHDLGIEVRIVTRPVEVADAIPFELDDQHDSYDPGHAHAFWRGLLQADRVMKAFQTGFVGKASPVHFFWGSFDHAATRFSGRPAPLHPGGAPNCPTWVMEEAYSREESSMGWWPSSQVLGPAFYAYTYPEPDGYRSAPVRPGPASMRSSANSSCRTTPCDAPPTRTPPRRRSSSRPTRPAPTSAAGTGGRSSRRVRRTDRRPGRGPYCHEPRAVGSLLVALDDLLRSLGGLVRVQAGGGPSLALVQEVVAAIELDLDGVESRALVLRQPRPVAGRRV
jgi:hypothetical protein